MISFNKEDFFVITGASSGIGQAICVLLNKLGASVIGVSSSEAKLKNSQALCPNPNNFYIEARDLSSNLDSLPSFMMGLKDKYGKLKGLVNCAGIAPNLPLQMIDNDEIDNVFNINYKSAMLLSRGFADRRVHVKGESSILFIASIASFLGDKSQAVYSATKASLIASSRVLANELAPNIRVNCVSPGVIKTEIYHNAKKELDIYPPEERTLLKAGEPEDVANLVVFMLSDKAKWITGANYVIDGGYY